MVKWTLSKAAGEGKKLFTWETFHLRSRAATVFFIRCHLTASLKGFWGCFSFLACGMNGCRVMHGPLWASGEGDLVSFQHIWTFQANPEGPLAALCSHNLGLDRSMRGLSLTLSLLAQEVFECSHLTVWVSDALPSIAHSWLSFGTNHMSGQIRFSARLPGPSWSWAGQSGLQGAVWGKLPHHGKQRFIPIQGPGILRPSAVCVVPCSVDVTRIRPLQPSLRSLYIKGLLIAQVTWASWVAQGVKNPPAKEGDVCSIPGSGRSPGGGNGNPPQYSCLENSLDGGAWRSTVLQLRKSRTQLSTASHLSRSAPQGFLSLKYRSERTSDVHSTPYTAFNPNFPGSSVVKAPRFQRTEHRFDPWSGNKNPTCHGMWSKTIKK